MGSMICMVCGILENSLSFVLTVFNLCSMYLWFEGEKSRMIAAHTPHRSTCLYYAEPGCYRYTLIHHGFYDIVWIMVLINLKIEFFSFNFWDVTNTKNKINPQILNLNSTYTVIPYM